MIGSTTSGRAGEYTPLGRNIADFGPYITFNTAEPGNEGGVDLFGSGQGYRPGQQERRIDGLVVSESQFMLEINSARIGGAFGLLEIATRMSAVQTGWRYSYTTSRGEMRSESIAMGASSTYLGNLLAENGTLTALYNNNWSALLSIITHEQRHTQPEPENDDSSSANDCDSHKKFLLRDDVINKFQNAWDDSNFGEEGKQQEQGGMIFWKNSGENIEFKDVRYQRMEGEWAHTLQFYPSFSEKTLASMSSDFNLRYIYHSHPFMKGLKVLFRTFGYRKYSSQSEVNKPSGDDYELLRAV